jgi:hypothetical protein
MTSAEKAVHNTGLVFIAIATVILLSLIGAYPTKWLINYLVTPAFLTYVFGVAKFTAWRAFWLNYLCATLFKGGK